MNNIDNAVAIAKSLAPSGLLTIDTSTPLEINFAPNRTEEIIQNVRTILTTYKYSVPLNRNFGIDGSIIDSSIIGKAKLISNIIDSIKKYEPRAEVVNVEFKNGLVNENDAMEGILRPKVTIKIKE